MAELQARSLIADLSRKRRQRGQALVELALIAPWIFFLFLSVADLGFSSYAAIWVQNAVRAGALYASSGASAAGDSAGTCTVVRQELQSLPNYGSTNVACSGNPLQVTAVKLANAVDGNPATRVTVIGKLFQSRITRKNNTERLVLVTPEVVQPMSAGAARPDLTMPREFMKDMLAEAPRTPGLETTEPLKIYRPSPIPVEELREMQRKERDGASASAAPVAPPLDFLPAPIASPATGRKP